MTKPAIPDRRGSDPSNTAPSILWFREDLRLADNPALTAAVARDAPVLCVYILEEGEGPRPHGAASRWWLHHALDALAADLADVGGRLDVFRGMARTIIPGLAETLRAGAVFWNRRYDQAGIDVDRGLKTALIQGGYPVESFNGRLIHEPWEITSKTGGSYGVYSPYWKAALVRGDTSEPLPPPRALTSVPCPDAPERVSLHDLALLPAKPDWAAGLRSAWTPGERGAHARLKHFLDDGLAAYADARDRLGVDGTSRLSPHLRFGDISPRQVAAAVKTIVAKEPEAKDGAKKFIAEIGWREFDYHVMFHHPDVTDTNLHRQFDAMPWRDVSKAEIEAWKHGRTGYPVVDAGMRELWVTGTMHNRVRMVAASFLIKHLLLDWRIGEAWFWDCLVDADPANNPMNWQWVAGSGADAAPFFRVFNPVLQGQKFDPDGTYVRTHVPELAELPNAVIHAPWTASPDTLARAGVRLGDTYPMPIIDHVMGRDRALAAYETVKR